MDKRIMNVCISRQQVVFPFNQGEYLKMPAAGVLSFAFNAAKTAGLARLSCNRHLCQGLLVANIHLFALFPAKRKASSEAGSGVHQCSHRGFLLLPEGRCPESVFSRIAPYALPWPATIKFRGRFFVHSGRRARKKCLETTVGNARQEWRRVMYRSERIFRGEFDTRVC